MRILLVGEYSNLHNSLKTGLQHLGHEVLLVSTGDAFKNYPSDKKLVASRVVGTPILNFFRKAIFKITKFDIATVEIGYRCLEYLASEKPFDVIQLINEYPFKTPYFIERRILKRLRSLTERFVILACGDDYTYLSNIDKLAHHPMVQHPDIKFPYSTKYLTPKHKIYHDFVFELKDLIISSDLDYHPFYKAIPDYYGLIPNPVNLEKLQVLPLPQTDKIVIFHGVNRVNYYKKGNYFFDSALAIINQQYGDRIQIICVTSVPYKEYIQSYKKAHIILDQTYALDQGYNALEAMAQGKVVFTGAGNEFCEHYNLEPNSVAIHAIPNSEKIAKDLEALILHPERIAEISKNAREFVEKYHDTKKVAQEYLTAWNSIKTDQTTTS